MFQKIKSVVLWFLPIIITAIIILICILIWHGYRENHHGYASTDKVIQHYITAWNSENIHNVAMCFNKDDKSYTTLMKEIYESFDQDIKIKNKETQITSKPYDDTKTIETATGLSPINSAEISMVIVPSIQTINEKRYNIDGTYQFITYQYQDRWFIHSFAIDHIKNNGRVDEEENPTQNMLIGDKIIGTMAIPEDWTDATINTLNTNIVEEISYMSPEQNAKITMTAIDVNLTIQETAKEIASTFGNNYEINDDAAIGNHRCTTVTNYDDDFCTIVWICKVPLKSTYTYVIELKCRIEDVEPYCDKYIQTYNL